MDDLKDPDISIIHSSIYEHVYEPAEDSYLLLDALKDDYEFIQQQFHNKLIKCVEIGTGSGIVVSQLSRILNTLKIPSICWATDINPYATKIAAKIMKNNNVIGDVIRMKFVDGFNIRNGFNILLFNPPYVPTPHEEMYGDDISVSWAGGENGREVLDQLLPQLSYLLAKEYACFYLVTIAQNKPEDITLIMNNIGFQHKLIKSRKAGKERLQIHRYWRMMITIGRRCRFAMHNIRRSVSTMPSSIAIRSCGTNLETSVMHSKMQTTAVILATVHVSSSSTTTTTTKFALSNALNGVDDDS